LSRRYGEELSVTNANVLLVGGINSGKSSFVNSAYSAVSNHVEFVAPVTGGTSELNQSSGQLRRHMSPAGSPSSSAVNTEYIFWYFVCVLRSN
jgi:septin family protein